MKVQSYPSISFFFFKRSDDKSYASVKIISSIQSYLEPQTFQPHNLTSSHINLSMYKMWDKKIIILIKSINEIK